MGGIKRRVKVHFKFAKSLLVMIYLSLAHNSAHRIKLTFLSVLRGSCFCNGHASQCVPKDDEIVNADVYGKCNCQHGTAGLNCEKVWISLMSLTKEKFEKM